MSDTWLWNLEVSAVLPNFIIQNGIKPADSNAGTQIYFTAHKLISQLRYVFHS